MTPPVDSRESAPASVEAEQALLGAVLYQNESAFEAPALFAAKHFFEPAHGRLWTAIMRDVAAGRPADVWFLAEEFRRDKAFEELGGAGYLANLIDKAPPASAVPAIAKGIMDLATRRDLIALGESIARSARDEMSDSVGQLITEAERGLTALHATDARLELVGVGEASREVLAWVDDRSHPTGVLLGLAPLDLQLGPILPEELVVIAGRPGMGKSALGGVVAARIAAPAYWAEAADAPGEPPAAGRRGVIVINGEMPVGQMTRRLHADVGFDMFGRPFPTYTAIRKKQVSVDQRSMMDKVDAEIAGWPIKMLKRTGLTVSALRSIVRRQAAAWAREGVELGAVVVDHGGLIKPEGRSNGRAADQMDISIALKELADELKTAIIALIQLNREVEKRDDKRPQLSDLRDSGGWEENADVVILLFRDAYYAAREREPDSGKKGGEDWAVWNQRRGSKIIEANVAKLREGEACGTAELWAEMGWNAIRGAEPGQVGGFFE